MSDQDDRRGLSRRGLLAGTLSVAAAAGLPAAAQATGTVPPRPRPNATPPLPVTPDHGIARWQPFDSKMDAVALAKMEGLVQFVWHNSAWTDQELPAGMIGSGYIAGDLNWPLGRDFPDVYTLEWFQEHHPDWILYKEDRLTPAGRGAWPPEPGQPQRLPLDLANPAVRQWMAQRNIAPALSQTKYGEPLRENHRVLAVDLVQLMNVLHKWGNFDVEGNWVDRFPNVFSADNPWDPDYAAWWLGWLEWMRDWLHARGFSLALNIGDNQWQLDHLNKPVPAGVLQTQKAAIALADIWVSEFVVHPVKGNTGLAWENQLQLIWEHTSKGKPFCAATYQAVPVAESPITDIEWAIAYYFLYRGPGTMLALHGKNLDTGLLENGSWVDRPELHTDLGTATTGPVNRGSGVWSRQYTEGIAAVNPAVSEDAPITLPPGTWRDLSGQDHVDAITIPAQRGFVLKRV